MNFGTDQGQHLFCMSGLRLDEQCLSGETRMFTCFYKNRRSDCELWSVKKPSCNTCRGTGYHWLVKYTLHQESTLAVHIVVIFIISKNDLIHV